MQRIGGRVEHRHGHAERLVEVAAGDLGGLAFAEVDVAEVDGQIELQAKRLGCLGSAGRHPLRVRISKLAAAEVGPAPAS